MDPPGRRAARNLAILSAALFVVRVYASRRVGFGDSEALYASYALHPQAAYLDHPGLVGAVARVVGAGSAPTPAAAHAVTAVLATGAPWLMAAACRACGASWVRSFHAALVFAVVPEIAIGLFALTPDLLLCLAWTASLAFAATALRAPPASQSAASAFACAGLFAGIAAASKASGILLFVALAVAYRSRATRERAAGAAPWWGLAIGAVVVAPVAMFEVGRGWPMLRHRLVDTQTAAGLSWRNLGALVGGQMAYLSPLVFVLAGLAARDLWRRRDDPVGGLLGAVCAVPAAVLVPLCLWSRVAEPHWIAPALLGLVPAAARAPSAPTRPLVAVAVGTAAAMVVAAHAWALTPQAPRLAAASYDPRVDLANELYGWPEVIRELRAEVASARAADPQGPAPIVVGPHWTVCAQLEAGLRDDPAVGCNTPIPDDFDDWLPRSRWREADVLLWVTNEKFEGLPDLHAYVPVRTRHVTIRRGGRTVRRFAITVLSRGAVGAL